MFRNSHLAGLGSEMEGLPTIVGGRAGLRPPPCEVLHNHDMCVWGVGSSVGGQPGRVGFPRPDVPDSGVDPAPPMDRVAYGLTVSHSDVRRSQRRYVLGPTPTHGRPWDPKVRKPRASLMVSVGSWPGKNVCLWDPTFPFARGRTPRPVAQLANQIPSTLLGT